MSPAVPGEVLAPLLRRDPNVDVLGQHLGQLLLQPDVHSRQERVSAGEDDVGQEPGSEPLVAAHHALVHLQRLVPGSGISATRAELHASM